MKTAFLFPGQASQYVGMCKDLYENSSKAREILDKACDILGFDLKKVCFYGPEDELKKTRITQPAIFVHSFIVSELVSEIGLKADMVAGHSLGEYSALVYAGVLNFEDGLRLVKLRGELMQMAGEKNPGTMAAVIGLDKDTVESICSEVSSDGVVQPANFNAPGQIVISGGVEAVRKAMELAKEKGAKLVKELVVSGAFHSPLMADAGGELKKALEKTEFKNATVPVYSNVTAEPVTNGESFRKLLYKQLTSPVLWVDILKNMRRDGAEKFYEIGPGKVLQGLVKRTLQNVEVKGIDKFDEIKKLGL